MTGFEALPGQVVVEADENAVAAAAATWLAEQVAGADGPFRIALAGGTTPRRLYTRLAVEPAGLAFERWVVFFGDERAVPPDDPQSNLHMAREALLDHVPVPPEAIHRMDAEHPDRDAAAAAYAAVLDRTCPPGPGGAPRLDVVLLGLGTNGHTASLFPGDPALDVRDRWVTPAEADYDPRARLTLTVPVLCAARHAAFLVTGEGKGDALREVIAGTAPAALVRPADGTLHWFLDRAAAASLAGR